MYSPDNRSPLCTHLVVGEEALGAAVGAGSSRARGSGSHAGVCGVGQGEGPSVRRQAHQRLGPHRAAVDPVLGHLRLGRESQQSVGTHTPRLTFCIVGVSCHKYHFCRDKHVSCRDKSMLVATKLLSRQAYFCRDKRRVLWTGICHDKTFVATKILYFCGDKHTFVATKDVLALVAAAAGDTSATCLHTLPPASTLCHLPPHSATCLHTLPPASTLCHLPPHSATCLHTLPELVTPLPGHPLPISAHLSSHAVSVLRKVWVLIIMTVEAT